MKEEGQEWWFPWFALLFIPNSRKKQTISQNSRLDDSIQEARARCSQFNRVDDSRKESHQNLVSHWQHFLCPSQNVSRAPLVTLRITHIAESTLQVSAILPTFLISCRAHLWRPGRGWVSGTPCWQQETKWQKRWFVSRYWKANWKWQPDSSLVQPK